MCDACRRRGLDAIQRLGFGQGSGNGGGDGRRSVCENRVRLQSSESVRSVPSSAAAVDDLSPENQRLVVHDKQTDHCSACFAVYDYNNYCRRLRSPLSSIYYTAYLIYSVVREAITKTVHCSHQNVDDGRARRREPRSFTTAAVFVARNLTLTLRFYSVCRVCSRPMITI